VVAQQALFPEPERDPVGDVRRIVHAAVEEYQPSHIFAMTSGGNDSIPVAHATQAALQEIGLSLDAAVHLATGTGVSETIRHAREMARRFGLPFRVYRPKKGNRYHEQVLAYGFPGSFHHRKMYNRLKERSIEQLERDHRVKGRPIMLVTGVREQESKRRMGVVSEVNVEDRTPNRVWVAPIVHWSTADKEQYMEQYGIPRNPVTDKLCISGECLCGSYASPGELEEIGFFYPKARQYIRRLEVAVAERLGGKYRVKLYHRNGTKHVVDYVVASTEREAGHQVLAAAPWAVKDIGAMEVRAYNLQWGCDPPDPYIMGDLSQADLGLDDELAGMMCYSCNAKRGVA
jgi:3'-phosphoadenosine 5'-phosphosulfate sulfotransferase (PAPS reductase)/FAD synthetase